MLREYTRNIESFTASLHTSVQQPILDKIFTAATIGKNAWLIDADESAWIQVRYQLYCHEMSVRTNWVEKGFGFLTGAAAFPYVDGLQSEPIEVRLHFPADWNSVATSLKQLDRRRQLGSLASREL